MCSDPDCTKWGYKSRGQIRARPRSKSAGKPKEKGGAKKAQSATEPHLPFDISGSNIQSSVNRWKKVNFLASCTNKRCTDSFDSFADIGFY